MMAVGYYMWNPQTSATEDAAWLLVQAAARGGLHKAVKGRQVSTAQLRMAQQYLRSPTALMRHPAKHRDMLLTIIAEARQLLFKKPEYEAANDFAGLGDEGDLVGLGNIFDSIWSGIKWGTRQISTGIKTIFKAGQQVQAGSVAISERADQIAIDVADTVRTARDITGSVTADVAAARVRGGVTGFMETDIGKIAVYGGLGLLVLLMVMRQPGRGRR